MIEAYVRLHRLGYAHSVEMWQEGELAGGIYGVALGAAFFGESMFHRVTGASKAALVALVTRLRRLGYHFMDCQQTTPHLQGFGAFEVPRKEFMHRLELALAAGPPPGGTWEPGEIPAPDKDRPSFPG
jgi:leucyl/phenylalanyl-tRNA--protein transferase